jgi:hypothetical protein
MVQCSTLGGMSIDFSANGFELDVSLEEADYRGAEPLDSSVQTDVLPDETYFPRSEAKRRHTIREARTHTATG